MAIDKDFMPECPFFRTQRMKYIECEGAFDKSRLQAHFARANGAKEHLARFCCSMDFSKCPVSKMLYGKYED